MKLRGHGDPRSPHEATCPSIASRCSRGAVACPNNLHITSDISPFERRITGLTRYVARWAAQIGAPYEAPLDIRCPRRRAAGFPSRPRCGYRLEEGRRCAWQDCDRQRRGSSLRLAAIGPARHARRHRNKAGTGTGRLGRLCAYAGPGNGDGGPCPRLRRS